MKCTLQVHSASSSSQRTLVLLDAAAYLPTHELDLSAHPADFVVASFYKMFGYPTGLGVLVLRTEHTAQLNKVRNTGTCDTEWLFGWGACAVATTRTTCGTLMVVVNENAMAEAGGQSLDPPPLAEVLLGLGAWCLAHRNIKRHPQFDPAVCAH